MSSTQLNQVIESLKDLKLDAPSMDELRAGFATFMSGYGYDPSIKSDPVTIGEMKAEWLTAPGADPSRAILYLHGGGYVIGSIETHRALAARLSQASGSRVLLIDYRLAPEHPHPAAVEDSVAAYRWLLDKGISPAKIALAGDSAGGGLTAAALVAIKDAGLKMPAAGVCISPWVDMEGIGESMTSKAGEDPLVQKEGLVQMATAYLSGQDPKTPLAAPIYADLHGLPPLLIQVGTAETLLSDATRLADRARAAGVDVTLRPWDNMVHVWHLFASALDEGQKGIEEAGQFVRKHTA